MRCCLSRNFCASSLPLAPIQLPSPMETHFWYVKPDEVNSGSLLRRYMEILSPTEKKNVLSVPGDELQKRALLARTLVRTTIARYQIQGHVDPISIKFRKNIYGKPEIGIDVEEKRRKIKNNILAFARRFFTSREVEFLSSITDSEVQRQEFIKLWTLKKAYVKALGKGFSAVPFKTFSIRVKAATNKVPEITVESSDDPLNLAHNWQFALVELAGSHIAAICMEKAKTSDFPTKVPIKLTAWKTIPLVEDECICGTDTILPIGLLKQF